MYIYDPFERRYITVTSLDQGWTKNLSLWKHRLILQTVHRDGKRVNRESLARARRKIREIFESGVERQRYGRWKTNIGSAQPLNHEAETGIKAVEESSPVEDPDVNWQMELEANRKRAEAWAREHNLINETGKVKINDQS